jgi:Glyoxalase-like domain
MYGGIDIAMKVPTHQYDAVVEFYRTVIGLPEVTDKPPAVGFELGPNRLWIDQVPAMTQAEVWLELYCDDFPAAAKRLADAGVVRCDEIEPLDAGFRGGWYVNPANIAHMVREADAW